MRIVVHSPYGSISEEAGVIYLFARYLRRIFSDIIQLRCSGSFSSCDRDAETNWRRGFQSCFRCMHDQREFAGWADLAVANLSSYMRAEELVSTRSWISSLPSEQLVEASFNGIVPFPFVRGSIRNRFGIEEPALENRQHEQMIRRLMLYSVRTCLATRRFNEAVKPNLVMVAGGEDFISSSVLAQSRSYGIPVALVRWNLAERAVKIHHPSTDEVFSCGLVLEGLSSMRGEVKTWPLELLSIIENLVTFLGIDARQLPLQMAK